MSEIGADYGELIEILREAQDAVRKGLKLLRGQEMDREALLDLLTAVRSCADLAQSLFVTMRDRGSDEASWVEVSDLAKSFWATEDRIELTLGLDHE